MRLGKLNLFGNQQAMPQQNQSIQPPVAPGQFGGGNYTPLLGRGLKKFLPMMGGQGGYPLPPGLGRIVNGLGGGLGGGMSGGDPIGMPGGNPGWSAGPQSAGQQGYNTAPGFPSQGFAQQHSQQHMPPAQGYPSQSNPPQGYAPQGYTQVYGGQMPVQPAWEEPKKGGIKGFISNFMAKRKK